jgi:glycosyltransferase involved in cell wall biosynthesis
LDCGGIRFREMIEEVTPRICVDCSPLLVHSSGVKTYLHHWLHSLRTLQPQTIDTWFEPKSRELNHSGGLRLHPLRLAALQTTNLLPQAAVNLLARRCDILHVSNLLRTFPARPKLSATLHDLTASLVPEFHTRAQVEADQVFAERVLRRADGLIAVSENTRADAIRILRLRPEKIRVIYPGAGSGYFSAGLAEATHAAQACSIGVPYFLFVGTVEPRKNLDTLLDAWLSLPTTFRHENELVVAGMPGWKSGNTLRRLAQLTRERSGVRYLGYVPEPLLPGLTAGSQGLIYPSHYEGFGIPVVQAMAAGCPVIASGVSSLPEVTGGAALLIDPRSAGEIARAIRRLQESDALRGKLRSAGRERARHFTWEKAAESSFQYFAGLAG